MGTLKTVSTNPGGRAAIRSHSGGFSGEEMPLHVCNIPDADKKEQPSQLSQAHGGEGGPPTIKL